MRSRWGGSVGVNFKSSFKAAEKLKQIQAAKKKALELAINSAAGQIIYRTSQGQGAEGNLKPYSDKKYFDKEGKRINFIKKKGKIRPLESYREYKLRTKGKDTVTLSESGQMMQALKNTVEDNSRGLLGKIFFLAQERQKAIWNQQLRPNFFKLSKVQLQTIIKKLQGK